jgi:hypothetical protein
MVISMMCMDETTASVSQGAISEGFAGQRMLVVPRATVAKALQHPVTGKLLITDAGYFPHAARHGRKRTQPLSGPFARSLRCRASAYDTGMQRPFRCASEQMESDTDSPGVLQHP